MDLKQFIEAVTAAQAGERIIYHTGFLANDRLESPEVDLVAEAARAVGMPVGFKIGGKAGDFVRCGGMGAGALVQQGFGAGVYAYILVMRRPLSMTEVASLKRSTASYRKARAVAEAKKIARKAA